MLFACHPKILHKHCFQLLLGLFKLPRETEDNGHAKCWGDKQRALWYVMVFSGVVNWAFGLERLVSFFVYDIVFPMCQVFIANDITA